MKNKFDIKAICDSALKVSFNQHDDDGIMYIDVKIESEDYIEYPKVELIWYYPLIDVLSYWHPNAHRNKGFTVDWENGFSTKVTVSAPVGCYYNQQGENRLTVAYSNLIETVNFSLGIHEETSEIKCHITLFTEPSKKMKTYLGTIRIDTRHIPYYEAIKSMSKWYEQLYDKRMFIPEEAKLPMYSTWYSFHQEITDTDIEAQCEIAKKLGCESVIVDDGWQTDDNNRGYAFCGDWEVSKNRFPDISKHVNKIHEMGMKYLMWFSVPFIGIRSMRWNEFKDKILFFAENHQAGVLDPRYPEVRNYLISVYVNAIKNWNIDGLKLDFIDDFDGSRASSKAMQYDCNRDFQSVQEAVNRLLTDLNESLKEIKPDVMIEFRQRYIGPCMRKYANIFRVGDCPNNAITNRIGVIDLRLFSGDTAVHSDMISWNPNDTVESAALQFINIIFAVPQISVRLEKLNKEHFEMVKFWLSFWKEHRDVLLEGELIALSPEMQYPLVYSVNNEKKLYAVYADAIVKSGINLPNTLIFVNGKLSEEIIIDFEQYIGNKTIYIYNCFGQLVRSEKFSVNKGLSKIKVEKSGIAIIK